MNEMSKTPEGRIRIVAAAERLDFTVNELGQQHRAGVPQGETTRSVDQHPPEQGPPFHTRDRWTKARLCDRHLSTRVSQWRRPPTTLTSQAKAKLMDFSKDLSCLTTAY